jgi:hypothetical protein
MSNGHARTPRPQHRYRSGMSKRNQTRFAELDRARGLRLIQEARAARALARAISAVDVPDDPPRPAANDDASGPARAAS